MTDERLSLSLLKTFCALRGCTLHLGNKEVGFVTLDANGFINPRAYSSFNPAGEMIGRPNPTTLFRVADEFMIKDEGGTRTLAREEFLSLLRTVVGAMAKT